MQATEAIFFAPSALGDLSGQSESYWPVMVYIRTYVRAFMTRRLNPDFEFYPPASMSLAAWSSSR